MRRRFIIITACILLLTTLAYAITGEEAIQRLQQRMASISRVSGIVSMTNDSGETMTGAFVYVKPNKFHIKFSNPSGKEIITNGRKLWVYSSHSKICGAQDLDTTFSGGLGGMVSGYPAAMALPKPDGYTLKLKDDTRFYTDIQLGLTRDFFPEKMTFHTKDGKGITIVLTNLNFSPRVIDSFFDFNVPSNCQVVKNPLNIK